MLKEIALIVAYNKINGIGKNGHLLYHISEDLKHFKKITANYPIVMGRKTFESLPNGALPNRLNIILSRNNKDYNGAIKFDNLGLVLDYVNKNDYDKVFFIGGAEIYKKVLELNWITTMYITYIDDDKDADTFFPKLDKNKWNLTENIENIDPKTNLKFYFQKYEKKL